MEVSSLNMYFTTFLLINIASTSAGTTNIDKYTKKQPKPGLNMIPLKEYCCGISFSTCASLCWSSNKEGICCVSFQLTENRGCSIYDYGSESLMDIPVGQTSEKVFFLRDGFSVCEVAFIAGGVTTQTGGPVVQIYSPNNLCNYELAILPFESTSEGEVTLVRADSLVIACGQRANPDYITCWGYNIVEQAWTELTNSSKMHTARKGVLYKEYIYFFDAINSERYSINTSTWTAAPKIGFDDGGFSCVIQYEDLAFYIGGISFVTGVQIYNFTSESWDVHQNDRSFAFFHVGCNILPVKYSGSKPMKRPTFTSTILISPPYGLPDDQTYLYDFENDQTTVVGGKTNYLHRHGCIINLGQRTFIMTGYNLQLFTFVEEYDQDKETWSVNPYSTLPPMTFYSSCISVPATWFKQLPQGCQGVV